MRILMATTGSTGDLQPFLALGRRLLDHGHDVHLAAQDAHAARCEEAGVPFASIGVTDQVYQRILDLMPRVLAETDFVEEERMVIEQTVEIQRHALPELRKLAREADLVLHSPLAIGGVVAARAEGTPDISVTYTWPPQSTRKYAPSNMDHGPLLNKIAWAMARRAIGRATDPPLNTVVTAAGLTRWRNIVFEARRSALLDLIPISPTVLPPTRSAGPVTLSTGYWFFDEPGYTPPPDLAAFMVGSAPLVLGFGSTNGHDERMLATTVAETLSGLGHRTVVQGDFIRRAGIDLGPDVFVAGRVPHDWLFSRAAGVVHHGGVGTTAAAFRAGVPQAIVSYQGDQPQWGRQVARLCVGPAHCSHERFDAAWLDAALRVLANDKPMAERARTLGRAVRGEDGTGQAVRAIERVHLSLVR